MHIQNLSKIRGWWTIVQPNSCEGKASRVQTSSELSFGYHFHLDTYLTSKLTEVCIATGIGWEQSSMPSTNWYRIHCTATASKIQGMTECLFFFLWGTDRNRMPFPSLITKHLNLQPVLLISLVLLLIWPLIFFPYGLWSTCTQSYNFHFRAQQ
jgi:hypothetical protein